MDPFLGVDFKVTIDNNSHNWLSSGKPMFIASLDTQIDGLRFQPQGLGDNNEQALLWLYSKMVDLFYTFRLTLIVDGQPVREITYQERRELSQRKPSSLLKVVA